MNKKIKMLIWIVVVALISFGCYWFFYLMNNPSGGNGGALNSLKSLFPYGLNDNSSTGNTVTPAAPGGATPEGTSTSTVMYDPLIQLSTRSVVGMTIATPVPYVLGNTSTSSAYRSTIFDKTTLPVVRFAERGTGYVYDVDSRAQFETKQTGTTIVRAYEAYFGDSGNSVIFRYLKNDNATIETYLGKIIPQSKDSVGQFATIKGTFLPENISDLVMGPDGKRFMYVLPTDTGSDIISLGTDGLNRNQLFSSAFDEWLLDWKLGGVMATTKAASAIPGFAYIVQPSSGALEKVLGNLNGMTTNSAPDGKTVLYNVADGSRMSTFIRHANGDVSKLDIVTLPEKCVWGNNSSYLYCGVPNYIPSGKTLPDDWYQGSVHFQDSVWRVNATTGISIKVSDLDNNGLDVVSPILDTKEQFLIFRNNTDGTPWSLDVRANTNTPALTPSISSPFPSLNISGN